MDIVDSSPADLPQLGFIFLGGNLAVDLVNTTRNRRIEGSRRYILFDQLWDSSQAEAWWREASKKYGLECIEACGWTLEDFEALLGLRAELRSLFESIDAGGPLPSSLPGLNAVLARGSFSLSSMAGGFRRDYASREGRSDPLLAIALAAAELLSARDLSRLRNCRSERCVLFFYDGTKSGTRHWCSEGCMNRARARANYRKAKEGGSS
jgi:predicted RNA-binding Zn ribbon-like protein